jgi:PAS domain S-box-containing protein
MREQRSPGGLPGSEAGEALAAPARETAEALQRIAALERTVEVLQERLEAYRVVVDESPDAIFSLTAAGRYNYANRAFAEALGRRAEEVVGRTMWDLFPAEEADRRLSFLSSVFRTGEATSLEVRLPGAGGERHYLTSVRPVRDASGTVVSAVCRSVDITDRKRAEESHRDSEERYRRIADHTSDGIVCFGPDGRVTYVSPAYVRQLGYTEEEEIGRTPEMIRTLLHPEDHEQTFADILRAIAAKERGLVYCYRARHAAGHYIWREDHAQFRYDDSVARNYLGCIVVCRDITARRVAEEERARLESQLLRSQRLDSVGRLAGGVAHDFNNMLGIILVYADLARMGMEPHLPAYTYLREISDAARRSGALTRQLLAFARRQTVSPRVLDLNDTVAGMLSMLERLLGEEVALAWRPAAGLWRVRIDPSQVDQVLANLCLNARDATAGRGRVTIETSNRSLDAGSSRAFPGCAPGEYVALAVSDEGCGIPEEARAHLFEPFFTTKAAGSGTGLGLATVYGIAKQNDGHVEVASEQGKGATFTLLLPRCHGEAEAPRPDSLRPLAQGGGEGVLLVEDEAALLRSVGAMLRKLGYRVLAARGGAEALRLAGEHQGRLSLLLTDVVMPGMNGRELARELARAHPGLRVLFMSGYPAEVISSHGILDEGLSFLQKPFSPEELSAKVRSVLDAEGSATPVA